MWNLLVGNHPTISHINDQHVCITAQSQPCNFHSGVNSSLKSTDRGETRSFTMRKTYNTCTYMLTHTPYRVTQIQAHRGERHRLQHNNTSLFCQIWTALLFIYISNCCDSTYDWSSGKQRRTRTCAAHPFCRRRKKVDSLSLPEASHSVSSSTYRAAAVTKCYSWQACDNTSNTQYTSFLQEKLLTIHSALC